MPGSVVHDCVLFQRNLDVEAGLVSDDPGDVAPAREIVRQHDVPRTEAPLRAVSGLDLALARKSNHILAPRRRVPVLNLAGRAYAEQYAFGGLQFFSRDLYLLKVGLAVFSSVKSCYLHNPALVGKLSGKSKLIFRRQSAKRSTMISASFRAGVKAAIPIWIAYVGTSLTLGIAAKAYNLHWGEIVLMSALVFAAPAQFAALEPLASGKPALQILLVTFLINLRFLVMSAAIAPYFGRVRRAVLLLSSHLISISTFIIPYVHFQKQSDEVVIAEEMEEWSRGNFHYFFGLAVTSFSVWVVGAGVGYWAALHVPPGFEEGLKFMLPGYFASLLAVELRGKGALLIAMASFLAAVPGALLNTDWGWLATALAIGTIGWGMERWIQREPR